MLPYFDVFDNITFKVEGYDVTLSGQVVRPTLKRDAERVVEGRGEGGQPYRGPAGLAQ
jgi:hyperosmotically inducible periplasmic protein